MFRGFGRFVIVLAAVTAIMLAPPASPVRHDAFQMIAAEAERHASLEHWSDVDAQVERDHVHDDGEPHERIPRHAHGHDRGDHLHDLGKMIGATPDAAHAAVRVLMPWAEADAPPRLVFRLDRPPKTTVI
jgi:hypothetical protein